MRVLPPITIGPAQLTASNLPETDHPAWDAGTTYAAGARVLHNRNRWESLQANNTGRVPDAPDQALWWLHLGPANRWAMFDERAGTASAAVSGLIDVTLDPGQTFDSLALLDLDQTSSVRVQVRHGAQTIYDRTVQMLDVRATAGGWRQYFFMPLHRQRQALFFDLPPIGQVQVTINGQSCGSLLIGRTTPIGTTLTSPRLGITDYSRKVTDQFGSVSVVRRGFSRMVDAAVFVPSARVDEIAMQLADLRARPVLWVVDADREALTVYGFFRDWNIVIDGPVYSECSLQIEGLSQ